jgi:hypothetical protein
MKISRVALIFLIFVCSSYSTTNTFLQLGARPQGMGGAFVALSDDANAVFWNPAGLSLINRGEATFMHWNFKEISQLMVDYLSMAYPLPKGTIGFSWIRQGAELEEGPLINKSMMTENSFLLSYGLHLTSKLSVGLSLNRLLIDSRIGNGGGFSFEFGGMLKMFENYDWTFAAVAKNIVGNMKNESLHPSYLLGTAYQFSSQNKMHNIAMALDLHTYEDIDGKEGLTLNYAGGIEYLLRLDNYTVALRAGGGRKNYSYGFGLGWDFLSLDYCYVQMREIEIGDSHKFGVTLKLGGLPKKQIPKKKEVPPVSASQQRINLNAKFDRGKTQLTWNSIPGCDGYQLFGRIQGQQWKPLHKGLLKNARMTLTKKQDSKKYQIVVRAVAKGRSISVSNIIRID